MIRKDLRLRQELPPYLLESGTLHMDGLNLLAMSLKSTLEVSVLMPGM